MIKQIPIEKVHLALGPTDLRKSIDGLALIVEHVLTRNKPCQALNLLIEYLRKYGFNRWIEILLRNE